MSQNMIKYGIVGCVCLLFILWMAGTYNGLVKSRNYALEAMSRVEANYQRRADLIPALVEAVKGYAFHEKDTLVQVTQQWKLANASGNYAKSQEATGQMDLAIRGFLTVVQNYPELKANQNFSNLMTQLEGTENRILQERKQYGVRSTDFNNKLETFPSNVFAGFGNFERMKLFEAAAGAQNMPQVKF
jgi:LemA protein